MTRAMRVAAALAAVAVPAHAGGISRPNQISARAVGLGGSFTAIADDGTAWYFNPAGAAWADDALMIGAELVYAPRTFVPVDASGTRGDAQKATAVAPVPSLGVVFHPSQDGAQSRLAFGAGVWVPFGGQIRYDKMADPNISAVNASTDLVAELAAGVAYEVDDVFAVGGAVRMGLGVFSVDANAHPVNSKLSSMGVGVGVTVGAMLRPTKALSIGGVWRSGMDVSTQGDGTITVGTADQKVDVQQVQQWPQQTSLGVAAEVATGVKVTGQVDWTQWSRFEELLIEFPGMGSLDQHLDLDWKDSWTFRGGLEYGFGSGAVRAGGYFDTKAVPDRTIERQYLDDDKIGVSAGGAGIFGAWRIDGALDYTLPGTRKVKDNRADYAPVSWTQFANIAPGEHSGFVVTVEIAVSRKL